HNPFLEPANFLSLISRNAWVRLAVAVKNYREAKLKGRPIGFADLKLPHTGFTELGQARAPEAGEKSPAPPRPAPPPPEPPAELGPAAGPFTTEILARFSTSGPPPDRRGLGFLYAQGAKALPRKLTARIRREDA